MLDGMEAATQLCMPEIHWSHSLNSVTYCAAVQTVIPSGAHEQLPMSTITPHLLATKSDTYIHTLGTGITPVTRSFL